MLAEVWQAVAGWGGWPLLGFIIPVLVAGFASALPYQHAQYMARLSHAGDRAGIRAELTTDAPAGRRFREGIDKLLGGVDRYFGPPLGWRAFDRCLLHAYIYPVALFIIAWAAGAPGGLGALELLGDLSLWERVWRIAVLALAITGAFVWMWLVFSRRVRMTVAIGHALDAILKKDDSAGRFFIAAPNDLMAQLVAIVVAFGGVLAVTVVGVVSGAFVVGGAVAVAMAATGVVAGAVAVTLAVAGALAVTVAGAGIVVGVLPLSAAAVITFFVALPVANAALDWLSWLITRWLLRRPGDGRSSSRLWQP